MRPALDRRKRNPIGVFHRSAPYPQSVRIMQRRAENMRLAHPPAVLDQQRGARPGLRAIHVAHRHGRLALMRIGAQAEIGTRLFQPFRATCCRGQVKLVVWTKVLTRVVPWSISTAFVAPYS